MAPPTRAASRLLRCCAFLCGCVGLGVSFGSGSAPACSGQRGTARCNTSATFIWGSKNKKHVCSSDSKNGIECQYVPKENFEHRQKSFFNTSSKKCQVFSDSMKIRCFPFATESDCTSTCRSLMTDAMQEEVEEFEEEAMEFTEFIYHLFMMLYSLFGLALVCEEFFVAALDVIIEVLNLAPDVAGATFMAAGSSAPELFVAAVAVFLSGDFGSQCHMSDSKWSEFNSTHLGSDDTTAVQRSTFLNADGFIKFVGTDPKGAFKCDMDSPANKKIYIDQGIGVGAVVGSTMFNTMVIIGGSALVSGKITKLDYRIVMRDGFTYVVAVIALAVSLNYPFRNQDPVVAFFSAEACAERHEPAGCFTTYGLTPMGIIEGNETFLLLGLYASYVFLCAVFGRILNTACCTKCCGNGGGISNKVGFSEMGAATTSFDSTSNSNRPQLEAFHLYNQNRRLQNKRTQVARQLVAGLLSGQVSAAQLKGASQPAAESAAPADLQMSTPSRPARSSSESEHEEALMSSPAPAVPDLGEVAEEDDVEEPSGAPGGEPQPLKISAPLRRADSSDDVLDVFSSDLFSPEKLGLETPRPEGEHDAEHGEAHVHHHSIWTPPASCKGRVFWFVSFPLNFVFTYTIPNTLKPEYRKYYIATFWISIMWLGFLVDVMVEHAQEAFHGYLGIAKGPLGLTFVAAGTSFPDMLASLLVASKGCADMAVSNAFGSNIFDILLGLGLPWMLQCTFVEKGSVLFVDSMDQLNSSFKLLIVSFFLWFFIIGLVRWNLAPLMGMVMVVLYFLWAGSIFATI